MSETAWSSQVSILSQMLDDIEGELRSGSPNVPGLAEFKSALDDLRLRTWGLLSAMHEDDPHGFQEQFRTLRGTEMCRALSTDLQTGKLSNRQPDLPALGAAARDLAAAVRAAAPKSRKRGGSR
jgi:hypothetical protein